MEVIKRKITTLKDELENKEDEVVTLRAQLDKANIETEKAENEAASQNRRVCRFIYIIKADILRALRIRAYSQHFFRFSYSRRIWTESRKTALGLLQIWREPKLNATKLWDDWPHLRTQKLFLLKNAMTRWKENRMWIWFWRNFLRKFLLNEPFLKLKMRSAIEKTSKDE